MGQSQLFVNMAFFEFNGNLLALCEGNGCFSCLKLVVLTEITKGSHLTSIRAEATLHFFV